MTAPKRPMLTTEDRVRMRKLAIKAQTLGQQSSLNRAYCKGVADVLIWLDSAEVSPMLKEILG